LNIYLYTNLASTSLGNKREHNMFKDGGIRFGELVKKCKCKISKHWKLGNFGLILNMLGFYIQWKPLNVITLGQTEADNINWMITITGDCCLGEIGVIIGKVESWQH
jgi:hypothetical protein